VNGAKGRPSREVRVGDRLAITFTGGRRTFVVKELADHHIPKKDARALYEETTPALSPALQEARRLERLLAPRHDAPGGRLSHRERRERDRIRGA
jgi:ribosome-associated heat shock protein Hsp15